MCAPVGIMKSMKRLLSKSNRKDEKFLPFPSTETKTLVDDPGPELASGDPLFSQDFRLWFGKSTFEGILADIIYEEHRTHTALSVNNVLDQVAASYAPNTRQVDIDSQQEHARFYRYLYDTRSRLSKADWPMFLQDLSACLRNICNRLRDGKGTEFSELPEVSSPRPSTPSSSMRDTGGTTSNSSYPSFHHQHFRGSPVTPNGPPQNQQASQPSTNSASTPNSPTDSTIYTVLLKNYASSQGVDLVYEKQSSGNPISWYCKAFFKNFSGEGIGHNLQQAKHMAHKEIWESLGLPVH